MKPQIVLMPGLDGTGRLFDWVLARLPASPEPIVVRYPTDEPLGYAQLEELVIEQVRDRGPTLLVAESFSGPLALRIAANPAVEVAGVIFVASFVANPLRYLPPWAGPLVPRWVFKVRLRVMIRRYLTGPDGPAEVVDGVISAMQMVDPAVVQHRVREVVAADEWRRFATLGVPMAALVAAHDRVVPLGHVERMSRRRPDLEIVTIDGPHLLLECAPAESARAILEFASRLPASAP